MNKRMLCISCIMLIALMLLIGCNTNKNKGANTVVREATDENVVKDVILDKESSTAGAENSDKKEKTTTDSKQISSKNEVYDKITDTERDYIVYTGRNESMCIHVEEAYNIIKVISKDDEVIKLAENLDNLENIIKIYDVIDEATEDSENCIYAEHIGLVNTDGEYLGYYDEMITKVAIGRELEEKAASNGTELTMATYINNENIVVVSLMVPVKSDKGENLCSILYSKTVEIQEGFNPFDEDNGEITAEQKKSNWVHEKLFESKRELQQDNISEMPFAIGIGDKEFKVPFTGKELEEAGIEYNNSMVIIANGVSYGDVGTYKDGSRFELGFINNLSEDRLPSECYVASVVTMGNGIKLIATSKLDDDTEENYDGTSCIELGTSLEDTLKLITKLGCEIQCNHPLGVVNNYENYLTEGTNKYNRLMSDGETWRINLRYADTVDVDLTSSKYIVPDEFRSKNSLRVNYFDIVIVGKNDVGVTSISYDYSLVDANEYSRRYKDMYK